MTITRAKFDLELDHTDCITVEVSYEWVEYYPNITWEQPSDDPELHYEVKFRGVEIPLTEREDIIVLEAILEHIEANR